VKKMWIIRETSKEKIDKVTEAVGKAMEEYAKKVTV